MTSIAIPSGFAQPAPSASIFSPRVASPPPGPGPGSRAIPAHQAFPSSSSTVVSAASTAPPITHPFPTLESLKASSGNLEHQSDAEKIAWAQDVYRVVERQTRPVHLSTSSETPKPRKVSGSLTVLLNLALPIIISSTSHSDREISALASYLKGIFSSTGLCPDYLPRDPRQAFKEFESAARGGETRGWFMLGRDYESVGDEGRARDCLDRGVKKGDTECNYRMGMAHLLGQLGFPPNPSLAIPYLIQAAEGSTVDVPHPAYVYGMLLAGDFELPPSLPPIPEELLGPSADVRGMMARENIDKAAYLCHPPAQYKCGLSYEHATLGCPYDPLMSVQWYSLASQGGEVEADMALSKWFLCGAEGNFGKNEDLARTFAEKAARRGHPNGCFAMGYYFE
ncbi:hypothetical protein BD324DRAFT_226097 [Kockovaella imperatae]|uniref:HCP-like protein n=1 Tax=Kockovaella imperatae TaxID=4999 RepID=A0A1Y1UNS2_9TREE|nr:hypothetical protein BD324DRAFT_226097 [Kockovaella imperatae]ORX39669.1 hypothetical protein BD324DRAFT_226097 [Kockovaella imperatae]